MSPARRPAQSVRGLLRWLLLAVAVFVLWRIGRGAKKLVWSLFGIGMALWWSGGAVVFPARQLTTMER